MQLEGSNLLCGQCARIFDANHGFYDLLDPARGEPTAATVEQRLMESELVARVYDRIWRPTFVRVLAGRGASKAAGGFPGEFFIHKHALGLDERDGPWLDLSCGPGTFTRAISAAAPGATVVGLDISKAMLEVAASRSRGYGNAVFVRADAHELPFADESMGGVNNSGALHVYDDPERVFAEVLRVLRPGCLYVGATFARSSSRIGRIAARVAGIRRFDPPELRAWLSRVGFADYEEIRLGDGFVFRARKP
jgi:SAM-dependent methyltransferase